MRVYIPCTTGASLPREESTAFSNSPVNCVNAGFPAILKVSRIVYKRWENVSKHVFYMVMFSEISVFYPFSGILNSFAF